jgi:hypothetical protein
MTRRTVRAWLAGTMSLLAASVPAAADEWPEHGLFTVRNSTIHGGLKACEMQLSPQIEHQSFSLVWVDVEGPVPLVVGYLSSDPRLALAERIVVAIDGVEIVSFEPISHSVNSDSTSVFGAVRGEAAAHVWDTMRQSAEKATWLTVTAGDTTATIPAEGLQETLADFAECRHQRSL